MRKFTSAELVKVIQEMNNLEVGFYPPLDDTHTDVTLLIEEIKKGSFDLEPEDLLSVSTKRIISELGIGPWLDDAEMQEVMNAADADDGIDGVVYKELDEIDKLVDQVAHSKEAVMSSEVGNVTPSPEKASKTAPKEPKKAAVKAAPKLKKALSRYGHREGSMAADIDEMLWKGIDEDTAVAELAKKFCKTVEAVRLKFKGHVSYLQKKKNIPVTVKNDFFKTTKATCGGEI